VARGRGRPHRVRQRRGGPDAEIRQRGGAARSSEPRLGSLQAPGRIAVPGGGLPDHARDHPRRADPHRTRLVGSQGRHPGTHLDPLRTARDRRPDGNSDDLPRPDRERAGRGRPEAAGGRAGATRRGSCVAGADRRRCGRDAQADRARPARRHPAAAGFARDPAACDADQGAVGHERARARGVVDCRGAGQRARRAAGDLPRDPSCKPVRWRPGVSAGRTPPPFGAARPARREHRREAARTGRGGGVLRRLRGVDERCQACACLGREDRARYRRRERTARDPR